MYWESGGVYFLNFPFEISISDAIVVLKCRFFNVTFTIFHFYIVSAMNTCKCKCFVDGRVVGSISQTQSGSNLGT